MKFRTLAGRVPMLDALFYKGFGMPCSGISFAQELALTDDFCRVAQELLEDDEEQASEGDWMGNIAAFLKGNAPQGHSKRTLWTVFLGIFLFVPAGIQPAIEHIPGEILSRFRFLRRRRSCRCLQWTAASTRR